jgi:hypothetical protein
MLTGLDFMNNLGGMHNDLHSRNIMFVSAGLRWAVRDLRPALYTFKIGDFGDADQWFHENDERPQRIVGDVRNAAQVLVDVAVGRDEAFLQQRALDAVPARYVETIRRSLEGGFAGERAGLDFLRALTQA